MKDPQPVESETFEGCMHHGWKVSRCENRLAYLLYVPTADVVLEIPHEVLVLNRGLGFSAIISAENWRTITV